MDPPIGQVLFGDEPALFPARPHEFAADIAFIEAVVGGGDGLLADFPSASARLSASTSWLQGLGRSVWRKTSPGSGASRFSPKWGRKTFLE